jgi:ubiquinone biosynthesis protein UbiJ
MKNHYDINENDLLNMELRNPRNEDVKRLIDEVKRLKAMVDELKEEVEELESQL